MLKDWNLYGSRDVESLENKLEPNNLYKIFKDYRLAFGTSFTIENLIEIMKVKAILNVAESIGNAPEYLVDQIGKYRKAEPMETIGSAIDGLSAAISSK